MDIKDEILKGITVLYVEDELIPRETLTKFLSRRVAKVYTASSGREGLKLFKEKISKIDLVLTDILMLDMNGLQMAEEMRKLRDDLPIIIITAHSEVLYLMKAIEMDIDGYILKPVDYERLVNTMYKIVLRNQQNNFALHVANELNNLLKPISDFISLASQKISKEEELYESLQNAISASKTLEFFIYSLSPKDEHDIKDKK